MQRAISSRSFRLPEPAHVATCRTPRYQGPWALCRGHHRRKYHGEQTPRIVFLMRYLRSRTYQDGIPSQSVPTTFRTPCRRRRPSRPDPATGFDDVDILAVLSFNRYVGDFAGMCSSATFVACSFVIFARPAHAQRRTDCCAAAIAGARRRMASRHAWIVPSLQYPFLKRTTWSWHSAFRCERTQDTRVSPAIPRSHRRGA